MTIDDITALIAADESRTLELKKTTGELKDGMHSACAFLNTEGGWLIFGIAPKSLKILGQEVTDSTQQEIAKAITGLEPAVDVKIYYVDVSDRPGNKVIAMHFDGWVWGERPHTFHGCPYYKVESTTKVIATIPATHQFRTSSIPVQTLIEKGTDEFMTALELADLCGLKNIRHFRKFYLNPALADGAIERLYPDTPNHPQQKYRLTEAAKEWKKKIAKK